VGDIAEASGQGDIDAATTAFDEHGQELYDYCQSQLAEVADAAEVVEATFVIAAARASLLPNPERLRAWLFAVARCACHQQLQADVKPAYLDDTTGMWDWEQLADGSAWQADLLSSAWKALAAMDPAAREIVELNLRHRLDTGELADILGVPYSRAHSLVQTSRAQFEAAEDLLLAACPEQAWTCDAAAAHLNSLNGDLSKISPRWMKGHAGRCPVCAKRRRRSPDPAVILALLPSATMPGNERERLVWLLSDDSSDTADYRAAIIRRVEPFGNNGFPGTAAPQVNRPRRRSSYVLAAAAAAVAIALLGAGAVLADDHTSSQNGPSSSASTPASSGSTTPGATHSAGDRKSSKKSVVTGASPGANNGVLPSPQSSKSGSPKPTTSKSASPKPTTSKSSSPPPTTPPPTTPPPTTPPPTATPTPTASGDAKSSANSSDVSLIFDELFGGL
jgi:RNA polymerase sigma factor (sigma-70 family)